jgi:hypothetical protein
LKPRESRDQRKQESRKVLGAKRRAKSSEESPKKDSVTMRMRPHRS